MKKYKKFLLAVSATLVAGLSAGALAACGGDDSALKISFDTQGGEKMNSIKAEKGNEYTLPQPEAREGYEFAGWYDNADFEGSPVTEITMGSKNVKYYAKWTQLATITLDLNGGSLEKEVLYLKSGANVADFMKNYVPTKEGLIFGAWFDGDDELAANKKMPSGGLTLKAEYKVEYTVKLMLENTNGDGYDEKTVTKSDYVGKEITVAETEDGYKEIAHDAAVKTGTLSATKSQNVFTQYFERLSYTLTFRPNYPDGSSGTTTQITKKFDAEFEIPSDYSFDGYVLAGWSTSVSGNVEYKTNQIEMLAFNKADGEEVTPAKMKMLSKNASLYAVWKKGYTDMFGGSDTVFFLEDELEGTTVDIYLSRGGRFFRGSYYVRQESFKFEAGSSELSGKLYDGALFAYSSATRDESWSFLFDNGELVNTTRIDFGKYNEITYREYDSQGFESISNGTYAIEGGYYVATFTDGALEGQKLTIIVGTVNANGSLQNAFQIRKDDEIALGTIVGYKVNGKTVVEDSRAYTVTLNGFGVATCRTATSETSCYYTIKDDILTVESRYGSTVLVGRLTEADGRNVYFPYDESVDGKFEFENDDSIELNGSHKAVYTVDGEEKEGLFTVVGTSVFGGSIVDVTIGDDTYRMTVSTTKEKVIENGEVVEKVHYNAESEFANYAEYLYLNNGLIYYAPLLVLDEEAEGEAKVYGINAETNEYILASKGGYEKMEGANRYVYTAEEWFDRADANTAPFDLSKLKVIVFNVDTEATNYSVSYWYSSANGDKETTETATDYLKTFTSSKEDGATLELVSGFAFYKAANEMTYQGAYVVEDGLMTVYAGYNIYYFAVDEENETFTVLDYKPYEAYLASADGTIDRTVALFFDGTGEASYVVRTFDDEGKELSKDELPGTIVNTKRTTDTAARSEIWKFTADDDSLTFEYITVTLSSGTYIIRFNEEYNGEYSSTAGRLTLDGFVYGAKFVDAQMNEYSGAYFVEEENVVRLYMSNGESLYFDIDGKSFTVRGREYGEYLVTENQYGTYYVELDGYGHCTVYTKEEVDGSEELKKNYISENGEYVIDGDKFTVTYDVNSASKTLVGVLGTTFTDDGNVPGFLVYNEQTAYTYVNESDWSMILLDDFGRAVRYDAEGKKEEGKFTVIDNDLIYYTSKDQANSMIYTYDVENGTISTMQNLSKVAYYTESLESLLFTEYGFAVFNGTHTYYYRVDDARNVTIYRQDPSDQNANEYGFVAESFGTFDQTKEWTLEGVEKSYVKNAGWEIEFKRSDAKTTGEGDEQVTTYPYPVATKSTTKYPLMNLKFQPTDEAEFSVGGTVVYGGVQTACTVHREIVDEKTGEAKMYVSLNGYFYRFYIEVSYDGTTDGNTYEVVAMTLERELPSYNFLYSYYVYALFYGQIIENEIGTVSIHGSYDEDGERLDFYVTAEFFEDSEFKDVNGEILAFDRGTYEENGSIYSTTFTATDGETYSLHFQAASVMGSTGYRVAALTRHQKISVGNYTVEVGNIISTEATNFEVGDLFLADFVLYENGEKLERTDDVFGIDNAYYYVVRGETTVYYKITLTEEGSSLESGNVPNYVAVEVTSETVTTKGDANNDKLSVDISDTRGVLMIRMVNEDFYATESTYDPETSTYTVQTTSDTTFYVVVRDDGKVEISND